MTPAAMALIVLSAFMHAGWNLLTKKTHPSASFFLVTSLVGALMFLPFVIPHAGLLAALPARVWVFLLATGLFMAVYYAALAGAYRSGDLSVAYPLARSSPVIVVFIVAVLLGRRAQVSAACMLGIVLVVGGCFLVPMRRFSEAHLRNYLNWTCVLALLAALGTSGYSILDDEALRVLRHMPELGLGTTRTTLLYVGLENMVTSVWLAIYVGARREGRASLRQVLRANARHAVLAGVAIHVGYALVLISLAFARNVSYVVAFRQLSILLGTGLGIVALKEPAYRPKLVGVAIMFAGLVLVAMG